MGNNSRENFNRKENVKTFPKDRMGKRKKEKRIYTCPYKKMICSDMNLRMSENISVYWVKNKE